MEKGKGIQGFEDFFEVSDLGRVRNKKSLKIKKPVPNHAGYLRHVLKVKTKHFIKLKCFRVNRLVASTFIGPIPIGYEVHHINKIIEDNRACNLQILSRHEHDKLNLKKNKLALKLFKFLEEEICLNIKTIDELKTLLKSL